MLKIFLLAYISLSSCYAILVPETKCSTERCKKYEPPVDAQNPDHLYPSIERLQATCPALHKTYRCILDEYIDCFNENHAFEEWFDSDNETLLNAIEIVSETDSMIDDLCDPTTPFHQAYARNIDCIRDILKEEDVFYTCETEAKVFYKSYKKKGKEENERRDSCIINAHIWACVSEPIFEGCGEEARSVEAQLDEKTKYLKIAKCSPQHLEELKTEYLDFLPFEQARRSIYEKYFGMK